MEKCPNCGNNLTNINVLCPECGKLVVVIQLDPDHTVKTVKVPLDSSAKSCAVHNHVVEEPTIPEDQPTYSPFSQKAFNYSVNESVYTEDYLNTIRNMPLPELDDLRDFDPEAFLREYQKEHDQQNESPDSAPMNTDETQPNQKTSEESTETKEQLAEKSSGVERSDVTEDECASDHLEQYESDTTRRSHSKAKQQTKKKGLHRKRKIALPLAILLWTAATAILFFAFLYADNYAKTHYHGVNNMLYEISDGTLDLSGAMSESNVTME